MPSQYTTMCLILFAYKSHPTYKLVVVANRDEFYKRNTQTAHWWEDHPEVLGGRDLQAGGTWMGITQTGKFAALTNYREPGNLNPHAPSRGDLVKNYLISQQSSFSYLNKINGEAFNGFNLLVGGPDELWCYSNRGFEPQKLKPGIYGLSNHLLDSPWPKVEKGKKHLEAYIQEAHLYPQHAFKLLHDPSLAKDEELPQTGVPLEWERRLSAMFIESPEYGTRASTVLLIDEENRVYYGEKSYVPKQESFFEFAID